MSVYALKPQFTDREGYKAWRKTWKTVYQHISADIRRRKLEVKAAQRSGDPTKQKALAYQRADARKLMTLLGEAKVLRDRIRAMHAQMREQTALFPLAVEARTVDVHYNVVSNTFPFMPRWTVKANGKSYYCPHIDAQMGFSTRELEEGSTRGMLRFRGVALTITEGGVAELRPKSKAA
jgi:hypothetical protein